MKKIIIGTIVFLIVLVIAVPFLIPTKTIANKISAAIEESLHKKTTIESVRFKIFPKLGVSVAGLSIGEPKKEDFFVTLQSLFLEVEWRPLLQKQIRVSKLHLNTPAVEMYTVEEKKPPVESPKSSAEASNLQFNVREFLINQLSFTMFDAHMKPTVHIAELSENLSFDYASDGTSTIDGKTVIPVLSVMTPMGELGRNTKIEIQKKIKVDPKNLNIQELKIMLGNLPISLEGTVQEYASEHPVVDMKFAGGPSDIENIIGLIPSNIVSSNLKDIQSKGNLLVEGSLKGKIDTSKAAESVQASEFHVTVALKNGWIKHPALEKPMENIAFTINVDPKSVNVKDFHTEFGQSVVHYSAIINQYLTNPTFQFNTNTNLNLKDVAALHQDMPVKDLKGNLVLNLNATGSAKDTMATVLSGTIQAKDMSLQYPEYKYDIKNLNSSMKLDKNNIVIQSVSITINDSTITGLGSITNPMAMMNDDKKSIMGFSLNANSKDLNADKLMPPPSEEESSELPPSFYKLIGSFKFNVAKLTFNKLPMTNVNGMIGLNRGEVTFKPVSLQAFNGTMTLNGDVNIQNPKKPKFDLDTEMKNVAVDKALAYADNINKLLKLDNSLKANIGLKAKAKGELTKTFDLKMETLDSNGSFSLNNAVIQNHPIQKAFNKYFNSEKFQKIDVKQWTQAFSVEQGKLNVSNLNFGAADFDFKINGWQSLDGKNDFAVDAKLPASLTAKILDKLPGPVASLVQNQKNVTLPFSISGEAASPSLSLDSGKMSGVAKDQLTNSLKSEADKLTGDAKDQAKDKLKGFLGGNEKEEPKTTKGKTSKSDPKKKPDVKQDVKDKLKKLF
jgi:hypothetical protein